jgi:hypothetical protein
MRREIPLVIACAVLLMSGTAMAQPDWQAMMKKKAAAREQARKPAPQPVAGTIILSKSQIKPGQEGTAKPETSFTGSDNIYGFVKLIAPFKKWKRYNATQVGVTLSVGGKWVAGIPPNDPLQNEEYELDYYIIEILPDPKASTKPKDALKIASALAEKLTPGKHEIGIELVGDWGQNSPKTTFTLDLTSSLDAMKTRIKAIKQLGLANIRLPKAEMKTPAVLLQAAKKDTMFGKFLRVVVTSDDWFIGRNSFGVVTHRSLNVSYASKETSGKCSYNNGTYRQDALPGAKWAKPRWAGSNVGEYYEILCENVNK